MSGLNIFLASTGLPLYHGTMNKKYFEDGKWWCFSKETRRRMGESARTRPPISEETRKKLRARFPGDKNWTRRPGAHEKLVESKKKHLPDTCKCFVCRRSRGEVIVHPDICPCMKCKMKRGELRGDKNPMFGKQRFGEDNPMFGKTVSDAEKKRRSEAVKMDKNPSWKGGITFEEYGIEFNDELRERIRERDGHVCRMPGCGIGENGKKHDVHHIDYDKKNNSENNLLTLCLPHHRKTNFNRAKWAAELRA